MGNDPHHKYSFSTKLLSVLFVNSIIIVTLQHKNNNK